jgi:hypothetical protein
VSFRIHQLSQLLVPLRQRETENSGLCGCGHQTSDRQLTTGLNGPWLKNATSNFDQKAHVRPFASSKHKYRYLCQFFYNRFIIGPLRKCILLHTYLPQWHTPVNHTYRQIQHLNPKLALPSSYIGFMYRGLFAEYWRFWDLFGLIMLFLDKLSRFKSFLCFQWNVVSCSMSELHKSQSQIIGVNTYYIHSFKLEVLACSVAIWRFFSQVLQSEKLCREELRTYKIWKKGFAHRVS